MRRHLRLRKPFTTQRFSTDAWSIDIPIASVDVVPLVCELSLLLFDRSEKLSLLFADGRKLIISIVKGKSRTSGLDSNSMLVEFNRSDIEFVVSFLLTWYRDGVAEVNHIDIELTGETTAGKDCTIVIRAETFQPPLPGDEAERILREMQ